MRYQPAVVVFVSAILVTWVVSTAEAQCIDPLGRDCNGNGVADSCDIAFGTSDDCDGNGIPDECDWRDIDRVQLGVLGGGDAFGTSIDVYQDWMVVGAPNRTVSGFDAGAAFVLQRSGDEWTAVAGLAFDDPAGNDGFGWRVGIHGDVVAVAAPRRDPADLDQGAVAVFHREGSEWTFVTELSIPGASSGTRFGFSLAVAEDLIIVGAPFEDGAVTSSVGSVYVYRHSGGIWGQPTRLTPSDASLQDWFGYSLALDGDRLVVGAPGVDDASVRAGALYVFDHDGLTWVESAKLLPSLPQEDGRFGSECALDGGRVAASRGRLTSGGPGLVEVFDLTLGTWVSSATFAAAVPEPGDGYGAAIDLAGDVLVIGHAPIDPYDQGRVVVKRFFDGLWSEEATLDDAYGSPTARLGASLARDGDAIWAGAPGQQRFSELGVGSILRFEVVPPPDCNGNGTSDVCDVATGLSADCDGNGVPDECEVPEPSIVVQPVDAELCLGSRLLLAPQVAGAHPRTAQWYRDGIALDGEDDETLSEPHVSEADEGVYQLEVTNACGVALSDPVTVVVFDSPGSACGPEFKRGDANQDDQTNIADVIALLEHLFAGVLQSCDLAMDTNDDESVDVADAIFQLGSFFIPGSPAGFLPLFECGPDPTPGPLSCEEYLPCP